MPEEGWTPVARTAHRDIRVSWRARGLLGDLLSYPDGWDTSVDKLVAEARRQGGNTEGRAAMRRAMKELADVGYVRYVREADANGHWTTIMVVSDEPQPVDDASRRTRNRTVGEPGGRETGTSGTGTSEGWSVTKKTDTKRETKKDLKEEGDEYSESLTSFALASGEASDDDATDANERQLHRVYEVIDAMGPDLRRRHLLAVERKRPKIYRDCRNNAIRQIENNNADALRGEDSADRIDRLSYKWMAQHYSPHWPQWFARPLEEAYQQMTTKP